MDDAFGNWLAGFIDGEGCFSVREIKGTKDSHYIFRFTIRLRIDDIEILNLIRDTIKLGTVYFGPRKDGNPTGYL